MGAAEKTAAEQLATPVQYVKGVGPQRAEFFERMGLRTARDLIFFFPRDYQDLSNLSGVAALQSGELARIRGVVAEVDQRMTGSGTHILGVLVRCGDGCIRLLWFNQSYMRQRFRVGHEVLITGKPKLNGGMWEFSHPNVQWLEAGEEEQGAKLLPVYPLTEGLSQGQMRRVMEAVVPAYVELLEEVFPVEYLAAHDFWTLRQTLPQIHLPADRAHLERARRRLIYQELFVLQLALSFKHRQLQDQLQAPPLEATAKIDARICRLFPFELTPGQRQAIDAIAADMAQPHPMNRLLQGDVGSGKTIVAVYAMLLAVAHGRQAALMAPTEVLARQHAETLSGVLAASRVRWGVLTGGLPAGERQKVLARLAAGELDVVIGTQAILQADVEFASLGLVVIDEQHKFGVRQRASLKQSGLDPHYLVMTATPIPRTVAMTLFGDLDISTLRDAPPGRRQVNSYLASLDQRERWWEFFRKKLREGRQGYVITPLVEASEEVAAASLGQAYESLAHGPLEAFRLGLLHGRLSSAEKLAVMADFRRGEIQVLVATTVVEVGVDVPNATLMSIESGERFGLAQLHQLRGRVSRGSQAGFCCVFTESDNEEARRRLEAFVSTTDGFRLAEIDFELRGPGELLGTRQHGLPPLRIADLVRDAAILDEARRDAQQLIAADPKLAAAEHEPLRRMTFNRYGRVLELGNVG